MGMDFGIPNKQITMPLKHQEPLRAQGNLTYMQFIDLLEKLWEDTHPDIPIFPASGQGFAVYPCIVYGLLLRKTAPKEPKQKFREYIKDEKEDLYQITAQKFDNLISFTILSKTDPKLADAIIEEFEDFMQVHTPIFKRLGISDIFYSRRLSDVDENRIGDDTTRRSVAYLITTEKVTQISIEKIDEIVINVKQKVDQQTNNFTVANFSNHIELDIRGLEVGQRVLVNDVFFMGRKTLPQGLYAGWGYEIDTIGVDYLTLKNINGSPINVIGPGEGVLIPWEWFNITTNIEDKP